MLICSNSYRQIRHQFLLCILSNALNKKFLIVYDISLNFIIFHIIKKSRKKNQIYGTDRHPLKSDDPTGIQGKNLIKDPQCQNSIGFIIGFIHLGTILLLNIHIFAFLNMNTQQINSNKFILIYFSIHLFTNLSLCSINQKEKKHDKSEEVIYRQKKI